MRVDGLNVTIQALSDAPEAVRAAASRAINRATERARSQQARAIRQQVDFPASYLNPSGGRLAVTQFAKATDLEGRVTGRFRATSLARFVTGTPRRGQPVRVSVKPGSTVKLDGAFLVNLRSGNTDSKNNKGLAVRTGGRPIRNSSRARLLAPGLYLLYGPSVHQAFGQLIDNGGAADAADYFESEFLRQLKL